jgi:hypothetical protein
MKFQLKRAERKKAHLKLGLAGPSGSGKTYSALLLAKGLVGSWEKVAVIDTENGSADLYSHLGAYNTVQIDPPFEPEKYIAAMHACTEAGMEAIIIDSMSHEWGGQGGILDYKEALGGKFSDWKKATPRHQSFIDAILQCPAHVIACARVKTDWAVEQNEKGKAAPRKLGLKVEQRDGIEYEFTVAFRLTHAHMAETDKDRTGLFAGKPDFKITEATGVLLAEWANSGVEVVKAPPPGTYTGTDAERAVVNAKLAQQKIPEALWPEIDMALRGKPIAELKLAYETVKAARDAFGVTQ